MRTRDTIRKDLTELVPSYINLEDSIRRGAEILTIGLLLEVQLDIRDLLNKSV